VRSFSSSSGTVGSASGKLRRRTLLQAASLLALSACAPTPGGANFGSSLGLPLRTFRDDRGLDISVRGVPSHVAVFGRWAIDLLSSLGMPPIVAVADNAAAFDPDALLARQPDLVVGSRSLIEPIAEQIASRVPTLAFDSATWADSNRAISVISEIVGHRAEGERFNREFADSVRQIGEPAPGGVSIAVLGGRLSNLELVSAGSISIELLRALKADVVAGSALPDTSTSDPSPPITPWDLRDANPDVIVMLSRAAFQELRTSPAWSDAVFAHGRQVHVAGPTWTDPQGPTARRQVLSDAAQWLYPWLAVST
jgi:ABC-type Fe3+-hydroxamate transport system substrate-binding protein